MYTILRLSNKEEWLPEDYGLVAAQCLGRAMVELYSVGSV